VSAYCFHGRETSNALELVERLSFHRPTASYLLGYSVAGTDNSTENNTTPFKLPFRPGRFQYVSKVIAIGETPNEYLANIKQAVKGPDSFWLLGYDTFEPLNHKVSSSMLMCAVSRLLPGEPLLGSENSVESHVISYLIVETSTQLYLVEKLVQNQEDAFEIAKPITRQFREIWPKRPFHYSGAINLDVAVTVVDILSDILLSRTASHVKCKDTEEETSTEVTNAIPRTVRLLDPTVGSGTFVALAAMVWSRFTNIEVTGVDSNPKCSFGTVLNLMSLFSVGDDSLVCNESRTKWTLKFPTNELSLKASANIHTDDSTVLQSNAVNGLFDCAVTNLPWNRNTFEFHGLHGRADGEGDSHMEVSKGILQAVALVLKPRAPIVVISAEGSDDIGCSAGPELFDAGKCLDDLGFDILGYASIPPTGYALPSSTKKRMASSTNKVKGTSNCQILVALAPYQ
jgi:hypothetical protein